MTERLFDDLRGHAGNGRLLVSIPHTGEFVPPEVAARFASPRIAALPMTDWHLHLLYDFLPALDVDLFAARVSRLVVDLNRPPDGAALYPGRFETSLVPAATFAGEPVFATPPDAEEVERLRLAYHAPYHAGLEARLREKSARHRGAPVVLIDAHSVVSDANQLHGRLNDDIYLGDRDGTTCPGWLTDSVERLFRERGFAVSRNAPYNGGYTTAHYGSMAHVHALQIEMVQRLYMDEDDPRGGPGHPRFASLRTQLQGLFRELHGIILDRIDHDAG